MAPEVCTCGAKLPPDARFCHKCGKPQYEYPQPEESEPVQSPVLPPPLPETKPPAATAEISFHNRTAVGIGFVVAALAMLIVVLPGPLLFPVLRLIVSFFLAGLVAALWYSRRTGQPLTTRSGARMGWITGIFSFAMFVALITAAMIAISDQGGLAAFYKKQAAGQDPNVEQAIKILSDPAGASVFMIFVLVMFFVLLTTLPMLGGALGAKLSERRA